MMRDPAEISETEIYEAGKACALQEAQELITMYCQRQIDVAYSQGVHWMPTHPLAAHHRANMAQQVYQFLTLFDKKNEERGFESPWVRMRREISMLQIHPNDRPPPTAAEIHELQRYGDFHYTATKTYGKSPVLMQREIANLELVVDVLSKDVEEYKEEIRVLKERLGE